MPVDLSSIPMRSRRAIEAELAGRIYATASASSGPDAALATLNAAIDQAAREAGQAFAAKAPGAAPSLKHFSSVLALWQAGGALTIEGTVLTSKTLDFRVVRCGYMEMYTEMGLPKALHATLSCRRDAAFAEGYSPKLVMERPQTISDGHPACVFRFSWLD